MNCDGCKKPILVQKVEIMFEKDDTIYDYHPICAIRAIAERTAEVNGTNG